MKGFSLIETFVAITILMVVILGPLSAISQYFKDNDFTKNQIIAAALAQEGAEVMTNYIRNQTNNPEFNLCRQRDDNYWLRFIDTAETYDVSLGTTIEVEKCVDQNTNQVCDAVLQRIKSNGNLSFYSSGNDPSNYPETIFHRGVRVEDISLGGDKLYPLEVKISSKVVWLERGDEVAIETVSYLLKPESIDCW